MSEPKPSGLHAKLSKIAAAQSWITKDGRNEAQKYSFVQASDVINAVRGDMSEQGLTLVGSVVSFDLTPPPEGKSSFMGLLHIRYKLTDSETGEKIEADWFGQGMDGGDKALNKAYTAALKYFLLNVFLIPTGDDPEADPRTDADAARTATAPLKPQRIEAPVTGSRGEGITNAQIGKLKGLAAEKLGVDSKNIGDMWDKLSKFTNRRWTDFDVTKAYASQVISKLVEAPAHNPTTGEVLDEPTKGALADAWGLEA